MGLDPLKLKGVVGILLLSTFVLFRLFVPLPLLFFFLLPFSLSVGTVLTAWFLHDLVKGWSEFSQAIVVSTLFVPLWILMFYMVVADTPIYLRSGIGPFGIGLKFLALATAPFIMFFMLSLPLLDQMAVRGVRDLPREGSPRRGSILQAQPSESNTPIGWEQFGPLPTGPTLRCPKCSSIDTIHDLLNPGGFICTKCGEQFRPFE